MFGRHPAILSASGSSASFMRALQPAAWFRADTGVTVTGQGVSTLADQSGNGRDLLQGTDASRPPYLSYSGTKYLYLPGVDGNNATTPDTAGNSVSGDVDLRCYAALDDWTPSATQTFIAKWLAGNRGYILQINSTGNLIFGYSNDGTSSAGRVATASAATSITDGSASWVRATYANATGKVNFYKSSDGSTWSAIGTEQTITSGTIYDSNQTVMVGQSQDSGFLLPAKGKIYRALVYSSIGGTTPVVDFNPDLDGSDQAATITSSATGEVWTINKSGGLPAQIVGRPSLLFDGSADYLKCDAFTLNQPETVYILFKQVSWTHTDHIFDGNAVSGGALSQDNAYGGTPAFGIYAGAVGPAVTTLAVGAYGVVAIVMNGASSSAQKNLASATTGNAGTNNLGGFTLGARGDNSLFGNIQVLEVIIAAAAHDASTRARVIQYLSGRHGIAL